MVPVHLPANAFLPLASAVGGGLGGFVPPIAIVLWLGLSVWAAWMTALAFARLASPRPRDWGRWRWRLWGAVVCWVWVPVPAQLFWLYVLSY